MTSFIQSVVLSSLVCAVVLASRSYNKGGHCFDVAPFCANLTIGYTQMVLPNEFGHNRVNEVTEALKSWTPLAGAKIGKFRCPASLIKKFLCSVYAPVCLPEKLRIKPCRSFCVKARDSCAPVMKAGGNVTWPTHYAFNCSNYVNDQMCINDTEPEGGGGSNKNKNKGVLCGDNLTNGEIRQHFCASDFVLKVVLIRKSKKDGDHKTKVYKVEPIEGLERVKNSWEQWWPKPGRDQRSGSKGGKKRLWRLSFPANPGNQCELQRRSEYLVAGKFEDGGRKGKRKLIATAIVKWFRDNGKPRKKLLKMASCRQS